MEKPATPDVQSPAAAVQVVHAADWDPVHYVAGLSGKHVLVAWASKSGERSERAAPADSLATLLGPRSSFTSAIFDTDHGLTDERIALTRE